MLCYAVYFIIVVVLKNSVCECVKLVKKWNFCIFFVFTLPTFVLFVTMYFRRMPDLREIFFEKIKGIFSWWKILTTIVTRDMLCLRWTIGGKVIFIFKWCFKVRFYPGFPIRIRVYCHPDDELATSIGFGLWSTEIGRFCW